MGSIIGIPTTRVSDLFIRQRLTSQVQQDQLDLFAVQMQMNTGHRIQTPSEDAAAALRIMKLQRLLERKEQVRSNLSTNQSFLSATDSAVSSISNIVAEIRGASLEVLDTTDTDVQRQAVAQQVQQAIRQILDAGNQQFRGRYLFAGTRATVQPFQQTGDQVIEYLGNEGRLSSFADIDLLFDTNLNGSEAFGAISKAVLGSADLDPALTYDTRLADLNGGTGVAPGSILVSVTSAGGSVQSTIDISGAETIGDVAALVRANPPSGKVLDVGVSSTGLVIELTGMPGDTMTIREVGNGTTADDLGILTTTATAGPVVGGDLDPTLRLTTMLEDVLGRKPSAAVRAGGGDNDLIFTAKANGATLNGTEIIFQDTGSEGLSYDPAAAALTFDIIGGATTAAKIISLLEADPVAGALFSAAWDPTDENLGAGIGKVTATDPASPPTMAGGGGSVLDQASGLRIVNGGRTHVMDLSTAVTVEDLLNVLNLGGAGLLAEINQDATGIDVRSRISGADFMIGENGGTTATQLGLRTFTADTRLEDLNFGLGVADQESGGAAASAAKTNATFAAASKGWAGADNDLVFRARNVETAWNGFRVIFQDTGPGTEGLAYDRVNKTLTFEIDEGTTDANAVIAMVAADPQATADFAAELDPLDGSPNNGTGLVWVEPAVTTAGGDHNSTNSGLVFRARSAGSAWNDFTVSFLEGVPPGTESFTYDPVAKTMVFEIHPGVTTAGDVLNLFQTDPAAVADFAAELDTRDDPTNDGSGQISLGSITTSGGESAGSDFTVSLADGTELEFDLSYSDGSGTVLATDPISPPETAGGSSTSYASATVTSAGLDNDLIFRANNPGAAYNLTKINFQAVPGGPAAVVSYTPGVELTFQLDPGVTTAAEMITALAAHGGASADFTATLDSADGSPAETVGDVLTLLSAQDPARLQARLAVYGNGIELVDLSRGSAPLTVTNTLLSRAAVGLGLIGEGQSSQSSTTAGAAAGVTVDFGDADPDNDLVLTAVQSGTALNGTQVIFNAVAGPPPIPFVYDALLGTLTVNYDSGAPPTAQAIVTALASDPLSTQFTASLPPGGNGTSSIPAVPPVPAAMAGGSQTLKGHDVNRLETEGLLTALLRLQAALQINDLPEASRAIELLDREVTSMSFSRAELGARQQGLDLMHTRLEDEDVNLQMALSEDFDVDLVEAISQFTGRQIALEASLRTTASIFQMTLLNYL